MTNQRAIGRNWACSERTSGGFPFAYRFTCSNPSLHASNRNGLLTLHFKELTLTYSPLKPLTANIGLTGPLNFESAANPRKIEANWARLTLDVSRGLATPPTAQLRSSTLSVQLTTPGGDTQSIRIADLIADANLSRTQSDNQILNIRIAADAIANAALDQLLGNPEPGRLNATFDILRFDRLRRGDMTNRLDAWRSANGSLKIDEFNFVKGRLALEASGALHLDGERRLAGSLSTRMAGLSSLLQRLGLPGVGTPRGGLFGSLLKRNAPETPAEEPAGRFVPLPLTLRDGSVWVGPLRTPLALRPIL